MNILLQCTIPYAEDDWHVGRFTLLAQELRKVSDVLARNLEPDGKGDDQVLSGLSRARFDEVWLLGVDGGTALSAPDIAGVNAFQREGGGLLTTRDHQDMGMWLRQVERVGKAHFFHAKEFCEPDPERLCPDDLGTKTISWPNYHSGRNGDLQQIEAVDPFHRLLEKPGGARLGCFPAHPHEGAVGVPTDEPRARAVARGRSLISGRSFDLVVAFEGAGPYPGRAIAESSFHHFADYNWDISRSAPSFVSEAPGDGLQREPRALEDIRTYVRNAAIWLSPAGKGQSEKPRR